MDIGQLRQIVDGFHNARVMVIGDLMLEKFIRGSVTKIADDAPIPIVDYRSESLRPGGAANAMTNIQSLGGHVIAVGVIGNDDEGRTLKALLQSAGIETQGIVQSPARPTTLKIRIFAEKNQHPLLRIDKETDEDVDSDITEQFISIIKERIHEVDTVLISDQDKGAITTTLLHEIIPLIKDLGIPIVVDSKVEHFSDYRDVTVVKLTLDAAERVTGVAQINETSIRNIGQWMLSQLEPEYVMITRGKNGMSVFAQNGRVITIPSIALDVKEVIGVADTVTAVVALALAVPGTGMTESAVLANTTAGIVVGKLGSATVSREELLNQLDLMIGQHIEYNES